MTNLEWAMTYHLAGLSVFPCKDKRPHHRLLAETGYRQADGKATWQHMQFTQPDEMDIVKWFTMDSDAQIGLACGKVSGITVIDIDKNVIDRATGKKMLGKENPADMFQTLRKRVPITLASVTGSGGYHIFCRYADVRNSTKIVHPQIDIKSQGGYVILPPSTHESGNSYAWLPDYEWGNKTLPDFPMALGTATDDVPKKGQRKKWEELLQETLVGDRHMSLLRVAGVLTHVAERDAVFAYGLLKAYNQVYMNPPKPESEVLKIFDDIFQKNKSKRYGS